ncbi:MAG: hypothetical protein ACE5OR_16290 [bacterium]
MFDILIKGGEIIDGSGKESFKADIGIKGDRIVALDEMIEAEAERVIRAPGLMVSPGFVDLHSHSDLIFALEKPEQAEFYAAGLCRE